MLLFFSLGDENFSNSSDDSGKSNWQPEPTSSALSWRFKLLQRENNRSYRYNGEKDFWIHRETASQQEKYHSDFTKSSWMWMLSEQRSFFWGISSRKIRSGRRAFYHWRGSGVWEFSSKCWPYLSYLDQKELSLRSFFSCFWVRFHLCTKTKLREARFPRIWEKISFIFSLFAYASLFEDY